MSLKGRKPRGNLPQKKKDLTNGQLQQLERDNATTRGIYASSGHAEKEKAITDPKKSQKTVRINKPGFSTADEGLVDLINLDQEAKRSRVRAMFGAPAQQ